MFGRANGDSSPQKVHAQLIAEVESIKPGIRFCVALALTMEEGWHTYWKNPGDSGLPTTIEWNLPEGFSVGEIQWPYPQRFETSGIVSFGYADEVFLLMDMQAPVTLKPGTVAKFSASVDWLACKEECVSEHADLIIEIPVKDHDSRVDLKRVEHFKISRNNLPKLFKNWNIIASANGEKIVIQALPHISADSPSIDVFFFPEEEGIVDYSEPQKVETLRSGYLIEIKRSKFSTNLPSRLKGILYSTQGWDASGQMNALLVDVPLQNWTKFKQEVVR
jgi:thiol:disulfide interchange protein DsbD